MLIEMKQELSWRNDSLMKMNVIRDGEIIGCFESPYIPREDLRTNGLFQFRGTYCGEHNYDIQFQTIPCPKDYTDGMFSYTKKDSTTGIKYTMMKMSYDVTKDNQTFTQIFTMQEAQPKKWLFSPAKTLDYYAWQLGTDRYQCYHISKQGMGVWYCVYKNNTLVAEIHKSMHVTDYLNHYKLYLADNENAELMCLITGILHGKHYETVKPNTTGDLKSENIMETKNQICNEMRQGMLDKFDPEFPKRVG